MGERVEWVLGGKVSTFLPLFMPSLFPFLSLYLSFSPSTPYSMTLAGRECEEREQI